MRKRGRLRDVAPGAADGRGGAVVLVGPAPNGKTTLLSPLRSPISSGYRARQRVRCLRYLRIRHCDRFLRRGSSACRSEWRLITATHNLLKLWRHSTAPLAA